MAGLPPPPGARNAADDSVNVYYNNWTRENAGYRFTGKNIQNGQVFPATLADWNRLLPLNSEKRKRLNEATDDEFVGAATPLTGLRRSERRAAESPKKSQQIESDADSDESNYEDEVSKREQPHRKGPRKPASVPAKPAPKAARVKQTPLKVTAASLKVTAASPKVTAASPKVTAAPPKVTAAPPKVASSSTKPPTRATRNSGGPFTTAEPAPKKQRQNASADTMLTWTYEMRFVINELFVKSNTTKIEKNNIFNYVLKDELSAIGLYKKIDSEKMRKQFGDKTRKDRPTPANWIQITADEQLDAANDAAGVAGDTGRARRDALKGKVAAAAAHFHITL